MYSMMKKILFSILIFICSLAISQQSFELLISTEESESFNFTFENVNNDFVSVGARSIEFSSDSNNAFIVKYDNFGNIINQKEFIKNDTSFGLSYGVQKNNGNYLLFGVLTDSLTPHDHNVTYVCEMTPGLDLIWEKMHPIPEPYHDHKLINFLMDADSNIIIQGKADSSLYEYDDLLMTMVIDINGNLLDFNFYEGWKDYSIYGDMVFNHDSTAIEFFGLFVRPISYSNDWIEMDLSLDIIEFISVIDDEHIIYDPVSVQKMGTDKFVMANVAIMEPGAYLDLYVKIMDTNLNTLKDTLLLYPERTSLTGKNGLGFIDPNNIWVPTFEDNSTSFMGTEVFRFHLFDSELNLKAMKEYGGDTRYWFFNMLVTSDGGCLLTGVIPDYEGSWNHDAYVIKVMPEDIITFAEETPFENDKDVMVFPNPFSTEIKIQTARKNLVFNLTDIAGTKILSKEIDNIPGQTLITETLSSGSYFYTIQYESRTIQSGKLLKQQ